jgi:hypothetical protein
LRISHPSIQETAMAKKDKKKDKNSGKTGGTGLNLDRLKQIDLKNVDRQQLGLGAAAILGGIGLIALGLRLRDRAGQGGSGEWSASEDSDSADSVGAIDRALGMPSESAGELGGASANGTLISGSTPAVDDAGGSVTGGRGTETGGDSVGRTDVAGAGMGATTGGTGAGVRTGATGSASGGATGDISGGDAAPDLALDQPRPGSEDRAPSAFRPDVNAPVPDDKRDAFAPATMPNPNKTTPAM